MSNWFHIADRDLAKIAVTLLRESMKSVFGQANSPASRYQAIVALGGHTIEFRFTPPNDYVLMVDGYYAPPFSQGNWQELSASLEQMAGLDPGP